MFSIIAITIRISISTNTHLMHILHRFYIFYFIIIIIGDHNYDYPPNAIGTVLGPNTQECYEESSVIDIKSVLTAHHKGHFEVSFMICYMYSCSKVHVRIFLYVYLLLC